MVSVHKLRQSTGSKTKHSFQLRFSRSCSSLPVSLGFLPVKATLSGNSWHLLCLFVCSFLFFDQVVSGVGGVIALIVSPRNHFSSLLQKFWIRIYTLWCGIALIYIVASLASGQILDQAKIRCETIGVVSAYRNNIHFCREEVEKQLAISSAIILIIVLSVMVGVIDTHLIF